MVLLTTSDSGSFAVKNVVLAGFGHITLLDLDTIDLSNLNRQFLFRKKDVKQSKALVRRSPPPSAPSFVLRSHRVSAFPSGGSAHSIRI
jgi:molybdopterin/thiamine biosynthesis adenylyltransferase